MGKQKEINLRKRCLRKNFFQAMKNHRCSNQNFPNMTNAEASTDSLKEQLSVTNHIEHSIAVGIPTKHLLEDDSMTVMPYKKKRRMFPPNTAVQKIPISGLAALPQIQSPVFHNCKPIPAHVLILYAEAQQILKNAERDIGSFFGNVEMEENFYATAPTFDDIPTLDGNIVYKEIASFKDRHIYKKFYNKNLMLGHQLKAGIETSNKYLSVLRQAIKMLPIYPIHMKKLITKFNEAFLTYKLNPVHGQYKTLCRHLVLVKTLIAKFNNKHGLPTDMKRKPMADCYI